ncbi:retrovirus-related Pol polyprotein from transposon 17.6 [Trichonephila clavipes]|nr:retrovirus-related Pol polyprotein from transposon 17.6 [Trichonephila clavipes]
MKKKCSPECKEHYLDIWEELISPEMKPECPPKREYSHQVPNERSPLRCYGCWKQGVIKSRCPTCNLNASQRTDIATNHIKAYTAQTRSPRLTLIDITFCGIKGRVCANTGSSHSIAGERMFQIFKDKGLFFQETTLAMSLADGQQTTGEALTTQERGVPAQVSSASLDHGSKLCGPLPKSPRVAKQCDVNNQSINPKAKRNRTLLGTDFLSSAGLVLDVKNTCWYFWDNPTHKYPFGEELDTSSIVEKMSSNTCQLREGEGESLTSAQKEKLNLWLESFQNVFEPGGEATNILEHHINTGNSPLISVPPYRMSPVKNCPDCIKYKASNQKPSGLLQTAQHFET